MKDWTGTITSTFKTIGASNHTDKEREHNDYYATEPRAAELLCDLFQFSPYIWECACGAGHLAKVFEKRGYLVKATDLIDRGYGEGGIVLCFITSAKSVYFRIAIYKKKSVCI